ncbi:MAG: hypothetical protein O2822_06645 [Chloroflexi bacterium]|nr:hypothetical protein [Chloroflexota bacterium]
MRDEPGPKPSWGRRNRGSIIAVSLVFDLIIIPVVLVLTGVIPPPAGWF